MGLLHDAKLADLVQLRQSLAELPQLRVSFSGGDVCPAALIRYKVLAMVDAVIQQWDSSSKPD